MKTITAPLLSLAFASSFTCAVVAQRQPAIMGPENTAQSARAKDRVDVLTTQPDLSIFTAAMKAAGLGEILRGEGSYTVLAPANDAFRVLPDGMLEELMKPGNRDKLVELLRYHIIPRRIPSSAISTEDVATLQGSRVILKADGGTIWVGRGEVMRADLNAANGVIHVINVVLEPDEEAP